MFVKFSALVDEMRGKYNGSVFRKMQNGKTYVQPKPPTQSTAKLTKADAGRSAGIKTNVTEVSNAWNNLTSAQKLQWNAVAPLIPHTDKFGNPTTLNGFQYFMLISLQTKYYFNAVPGFPPTLQVVPIFPDVTTDVVGPYASLDVEIEVSANQAEPWYLVVYASAPRAIDRAIRYRNYKFLGSISYDAVSKYSIKPLYEQAFGTIQQNSAIDFKCYWMHEITCQKSPEFIISANINV
jgi:hypothetical protein